MIIHHYRELLDFCLRKVRNRDVAADLVQESYARVLSMQQAGKAVQEPRALLRKVALNAKIDLDRRAQLRQHVNIDDLDETAQLAQPQHLQPEHAVASAQGVQALLSAIEALPPRCREAFCLYVFDGMPNKEIAARMGISLSMVNQYVSRGKLACIACQGPDEHGRGSE